eukprot:TRINITY_DN14959_c0_g2_i1.p1 TRINITY_DN14959_c0_g2~~TRINITY_DN14959_c0_g2_i1.p1  ORF type:complete len:270 (-),score=21.78 TRINITY_DN14959_c0_g2_i1:94-903(-)
MWRSVLDSPELQRSIAGCVVAKHREFKSHANKRGGNLAPVSPYFVVPKKPRFRHAFFAAVFTTVATQAPEVLPLDTVFPIAPAEDLVRNVDVDQWILLWFRAAGGLVTTGSSEGSEGLNRSSFVPLMARLYLSFAPIDTQLAAEAAQEDWDTARAREATLSPNRFTACLAEFLCLWGLPNRLTTSATESVDFLSTLYVPVCFCRNSSVAVPEPNRSPSPPRSASVDVRLPAIRKRAKRDSKQKAVRPGSPARTPALQSDKTTFFVTSVE